MGGRAEVWEGESGKKGSVGRREVKEEKGEEKVARMKKVGDRKGVWEVGM